MVPGKHASAGFLRGFLVTLASFHHFEHPLRKILHLVPFLDIETQREENNEADYGYFLLWLSSPEIGSAFKMELEEAHVNLHTSLTCHSRMSLN